MIQHAGRHGIGRRKLIFIAIAARLYKSAEMRARRAAIRFGLERDISGRRNSRRREFLPPLFCRSDRRFVVNLPVEISVSWAGRRLRIFGVQSWAGKSLSRLRRKVLC